MQADATLPVGTYGYQPVDLAFLNDRAAQFRDQVARRLSGELSEDEFKPLRLMNGLYLQLHAYMLRVAIPYGVLSAAQLRRLARIARIYDRGYGHFTTRAEHPVQLDQAGGAAGHPRRTGRGGDARYPDQRQLYSQHHRAMSSPAPLPTKSLIRASMRKSCGNGRHSTRSFRSCRASSSSRSAAARMIALRRGSTISALSQSPVPTAPWASRYSPAVGSGGRRRSGSDCVSGCRNTSCWLTWKRSCASIMRYGRRDNIYKARIKILVQAPWPRRLRREGRGRVRGHSEGALPVRPGDRRGDPCALWQAISRCARECSGRVERAPATRSRLRPLGPDEQPSPSCGRLHLRRNVAQARSAASPGDASAEQMDAIADLAERFSSGEIRVTHLQNLVLGHVRQDELYTLWQALATAWLGHAEPRSDHRYRLLPRA